MKMASTRYSSIVLSYLRVNSDGESLIHGDYERQTVSLP